MHYRLFTGSLSEEVKALQEDIAAVADKVDDPMICEKVRLFVYAPREIQAIFKADAGMFVFCHMLQVLDRRMSSSDQVCFRSSRREDQCAYSSATFW